MRRMLIGRGGGKGMCAKADFEVYCGVVCLFFIYMKSSQVRIVFFAVRAVR